mmetsp:Transcript_6866/g.18007  ORF Transcript_6866/g.18007 Transcript_6866/m.18007 type:complete len:205 (-) Transcript_6866:718-1332(-)
MLPLTQHSHASAPMRGGARKRNAAPGALGAQLDCRQAEELLVGPPVQVERYHGARDRVRLRGARLRGGYVLRRGGLRSPLAQCSQTRELLRFVAPEHNASPCALGAQLAHRQTHELLVGPPEQVERHHGVLSRTLLRALPREQRVDALLQLRVCAEHDTVLAALDDELQQREAEQPRCIPAVQVVVREIDGLALVLKHARRAIA